MFNASIGEYKNGKVIVKERRDRYREDAVIVDQGEYSWKPPVIKFDFESRNPNLKYKVKFYREVKYYSPEYGYSVRSEYIFEPL